MKFFNQLMKLLSVWKSYDKAKNMTNFHREELFKPRGSKAVQYGLREGNQVEEEANVNEVERVL